MSTRDVLDSAIRTVVRIDEMIEELCMTTEPMANNQCALHQAVLVASANGVSDGPAIVAMAGLFYGFLNNPGSDSGAGTAAGPAVVNAGVPVVSEPGPESVDPPADQPGADGAAAAADAE